MPAHAPTLPPSSAQVADGAQAKAEFIAYSDLQSDAMPAERMGERAWSSRSPPFGACRRSGGAAQVGRLVSPFSAARLKGKDLGACKGGVGPRSACKARAVRSACEPGLERGGDGDHGDARRTRSPVDPKLTPGASPLPLPFAGLEKKHRLKRRSADHGGGAAALPKRLRYDADHLGCGGLAPMRE